LALRWGRPEEQWLDTGEYPLAPAPEQATTAACMAVLLHDLEAARDPDSSGGWFGYWGPARPGPWLPWTADPSPVDFAALAGLDLGAYPNLRVHVAEDEGSASWKLRVLGLGPPVDDADRSEEAHKALFGAMLSATAARILGAPGAPAGDERTTTSGWHSTREAFGLASLYAARPDLRRDIPLRRILDSWVEAIRESPLPMRARRPSSPYQTDCVGQVAYGVAALESGHRALGDEAYAAARDAVLKAMRDASAGECEAMSAGSGLDESTPAGAASASAAARWESSRTSLVAGHMASGGHSSEKGLCHFVAVYGQLAAFLGDDVELARAQDWIRTALTDRGPRGDGRPTAYESYRYAYFEDRCGMVAVLRSRYPLFAVPEL
jgi:hypothetical protein